MKTTPFPEIGAELGLITTEWSMVFDPVHFVNRYSRAARSGVEGDPFKATAAKGKQIVEAEIHNLIEFAKNFRDLPDLPNVNFNYQKPV